MPPRPRLRCNLSPAEVCRLEEDKEAEETEEEAEEGEGRERPEEEEALLPCKHHDEEEQGTNNAGRHWQSCKPAIFIGQGCCSIHPKES